MPLSARFAFRRVVPCRADGVPPDQREVVWLVVEWEDGKNDPKYHLCSLPRETTKRDLVRTLKQRWRTERVYEDLKGELGFDHFEGRPLEGLLRTLNGSADRSVRRLRGSKCIALASRMPRSWVMSSLARGAERPRSRMPVPDHEMIVAHTLRVWPVDCSEWCIGRPHRIPFTTAVTIESAAVRIAPVTRMAEASASSLSGRASRDSRCVRPSGS